MNTDTLLLAAGIAIAGYLVIRIRTRLQLSFAKHPSLRGHSRMSRRVARLLPYYSYTDEQVYRCDDASDAIATQRKAALKELAHDLATKNPSGLAQSAELKKHVSDMQFTDAYRVPFQFRDFALKHLRNASFAVESEGVRVKNADGNWSYDVAGSYGVNLLGYDFYNLSPDNR